MRIILSMLYPLQQWWLAMLYPLQHPPRPPMLYPLQHRPDSSPPPLPNPLKTQHTEPATRRVFLCLEKSA